MLSKPVCLFLLAAGVVYGNGIMICFGNNPASPVGTLSILCENRKYLFWIWALFVVGGYFLNTLYACERYGDRSKLIYVIAVLAVAAACGIGLSLNHDITTWNPKRIVHWISTGVYMAGLALSLFIFLLRNRKRYSHFTLLAVCVLIFVGILVA